MVVVNLNHASFPDEYRSNWFYAERPVDEEYGPLRRLKAKDNASEGTELNRSTIGKLVQAHLLLEKAGTGHLTVEGVRDVYKNVTDDLRPSYPDITIDKVIDDFSKYGQVTVPSEKELPMQMSETARLGQLIRGLDEAENGINPKKSGFPHRPPTEAMKMMERRIKDEMAKQGLEPVSKETQLASRLQRYKKQLDTRTAELKARNDAGDFSKQTRTKTPLDVDAEKKVADYQREKDRHDVGYEMDRLANRPTWQKISNIIPKITRFNVLTYPQTFAKLAVSAIQIAGEAPAFTLESMLLRSMVKNFAEHSTILKGASLEGLKNAYIAAYKDGVLEAARHHLKGEASNHEVLFGDKAENKSENEVVGKSKLDAPSFAHAVVKDPVKEMFFSLSRSERIKHMNESTSKEAQDLRAMPMDKAIEEIESAAWEDAKRAIYLDKNFFAKGWNGLLRTFRQMKNDSGKSSPAAQVFSDLLQSQMPIVRIAANIPKRAAERIVGLPIGLARLGAWKIG